MSANTTKKLKLWELNRVSEEAYQAQQKFPLVLVLDSIRSLNNIGSFFRTADAFNVEQIYLCGITAQPPHRDIHKTALGATETVRWQYRSSLQDALSELKEKGYANLCGRASSSNDAFARHPSVECTRLCVGVWQ